MGSSNHLNPLRLPLCTTVYTLAALRHHVNEFLTTKLWCTVFIVLQSPPSPERFFFYLVCVGSQVIIFLAQLRIIWYFVTCYLVLKFLFNIFIFLIQCTLLNITGNVPVLPKCSCVLQDSGAFVLNNFLSFALMCLMYAGVSNRPVFQLSALTSPNRVWRTSSHPLSAMFSVSNKHAVSLFRPLTAKCLSSSRGLRLIRVWLIYLLNV